MAASTTSTAELEGQSAFMRLLGVHFDQLGGERVTGWFEVGADHHQPWGLVHGGVTNVTDFLRPQRVGRLEVVAEPIQQSRTQQLWQVMITRAQDGKAVARGQVRLQNIDLSTQP